MPCRRRPVVTLERVGKRFQRSGPWVLDEIDLSIEPGSLTVIAGRNGAGKSTLLHVMVGMTRPTLGRIEKGWATVAFAPERLSATLQMSVHTYLRHVARMRGIDETSSVARIASLCEILSLWPGPDAQIRTLSKGNSQKVAIMQAVLAPVDLVVLDEPYTGLDIAARSGLDDLLSERIDTGAAVVLTTHRGDGFGARRFDLVQGRLHPSPMSLLPRAMMRIVLAPVGRQGEILDVVQRDGVVSFDPIGDGQLTVAVMSEHSDAFLIAAVGNGWSVVSVSSIAANRQ